jgi:hypothetical protein
MGQQVKQPILLGDTLETIFKRMGVNYLVNKVVKNCNCKQRKESLNRIDLRKIIPYQQSKKDSQ